MQGMIKATYENHMGSDLSVLNAARVSFGKRTTEVTEKDKGLLKFLARGCESREWDRLMIELSDEYNSDAIEHLVKDLKDMPTHWTPFAHTAITLVEEVPFPIARQRFKHSTATVYNEISRRYVDDGIEFYWPDEWRGNAENKKQGSSGPLPQDVQEEIDNLYAGVISKAVDAHEKALYFGLCSEQARFFLPQGMMTQYWVTGNLYGFAQAYKKRIREDAQYEIRLLAKQWDEIIRPLFPYAWSALVD